MVPLWVKLAYTLLAAVVVGVYARKYPLTNFLWFSDIALIGTVPALWLESQLVASVLAVSVLLPEVVWNVSFFARLLTGARLTGLTDYMFDPERPRYLRGLSLFHVILPVLLVWLVARLGYAPSAWGVQTVVAWVVLPVTYALSDPEQNVNWVYGPSGKPQHRLPRLVYLALVMIAFPALVYGPTHLLLQELFA